MRRYTRERNIWRNGSVYAGISNTHSKYSCCHEYQTRLKSIAKQWHTTQVQFSTNRLFTTYLFHKNGPAVCPAGPFSWCLFRYNSSLLPFYDIFLD